MIISLYRVTVKHDKGIVHLTLGASSEESAILAVMEAERCPRGAIRKCRVVRVLHRGE